MICFDMVTSQRVTSDFDLREMFPIKFLCVYAEIVILMNVYAKVWPT